MSSAARPGAISEAVHALSEGELDVVGRLVVASNATLLCKVATSAGEIQCVYKPVAGESPLWDFPDGTLAAREVAAYLVSQAAGWNLVPPTVLRDGPFGPGMCQLWIDEAGEQLIDVVALSDVPAGWLRVLEAVDGNGAPVALVHADDPRLRRMALFDVVINNADRKGGHVLVDESGALFGVDHGVSFHHDDKLRTVLWGWGGDALTSDESSTLRSLRSLLDGALGDELATLLTRAEVRAARDRVEELIGTSRLPEPGHRVRPIPWPAF